MNLSVIIILAIFLVLGLYMAKYIKSDALFLLSILVLILVTIPLVVKAETYYTFSYKTADSLKVSVRAASREEAFSKASKECFRILTKGVYPGEKSGLEMVDICANPKKGL